MNDYKSQIEQLLANIENEDLSTKSDRATVTLDQQSVGRLSRMDAMQQQAMANATFQRRQHEKIRLTQALKRICEGEFGFCQECGDDIPPERLKLNPTVLCCIGCARG